MIRHKRRSMLRRQVTQGAVASLLCITAITAAEADVRLVGAVKQSNRAEVQKLLKQHVDVNTVEVDGATALHWATYNDDMENAEILIRAGANAKVTNRYGVAPLSLACTNGNERMVELLLKAGADPNTSLPGGETALMTAARTGKVAPIRMLLSWGANVHAADSRGGQTAIMWAAAEGNAEAVGALIEAGADFRARLNSGLTPLLLAVREGQSDVVRVLLKAGADVNDTIQQPAGSKGPFGRGTLPRAGLTALALAVVNCHYQLAAELLDEGADPNAAKPGWTPLHAITWVRKPGSGSNRPSPPGSGRMTSIELVKKLAEKGANLNAPMTQRMNGMTRLNTIGATPFLLAARTGDAELMRVLATLGADPLRPNADNSTPLMVAAGLGTSSPSEDAGTDSEAVEAVKAALELGNDINAVDKNGETAMHGAAYKNLPGTVQFLADKGARIEIWNQKNKSGWTPLWIAEGHRFGNFKPSPETIVVFQRIMTKAGVSTASMPSQVGENIAYPTPVNNQP